jgi:hypothetical protein
LYCPKCGCLNPDAAVTCERCLEAMPSVSVSPQSKDLTTITDYTIWSVLVTVLCCLIPGIMAVVKSVQCSNLKLRGDYEGALAASKAAKNWLIGSAVAGLIWSITWIGFTIISAMRGGNQ